jgi:predicted transcriptional regulator
VSEVTDPERVDETITGLYHALRAPRRRYVIQILDQHEGMPITTRELARKVTSREKNLSEQRATGEPYRNVYNALSQTHLPTLADAGIIIYDSHRQTVQSGTNFRLIDVLADHNLSTVELFESLVSRTSSCDDQQ